MHVFTFLMQTLYKLFMNICTLIGALNTIFLLVVSLAPIYVNQ